MASLELMGDPEPLEYDSDEGTIDWEGSNELRADETHAQAGLAKLNEVESSRGGASAGRRFDHMQKLLAGVELAEPDYPHTVIAFRDSGFGALKQHEKESMNFESERGKEVAQLVMGNHHLHEYVSKAFLDGESGEHDVVFDTLGGDKVRILPPRVPKSSLAAGARIEEPVIRLETSEGKILKHTTVRRAFEKDPKNPFQKILVVNEPLAKWAKAKAPSK